MNQSPRARSQNSLSNSAARGEPLRSYSLTRTGLRLHRPLAAVVGAGLLLLATGCSDAQKRAWDPRTPEENFRNALEGPSADVRRDAVARIAESNYFAREDAFQVLEVVARTDSVEQVRCIAIRALARYYDDRPVRPLIAILRATPETKTEALPGGEEVRWEAVTGLRELERRGVIEGEQRSACVDLLIRLAESDPSRNVRIVATQSLGAYHDRRVLAPLIRTLRNEDFALADAAERSLIALTGVTHDYDPNAWEKWAAEASDPFANAGQTPVTTKPAGPTWWDRQMRAWRRGLKLRNRD